ncbi:hypothetical protein EV127DRAFT_493975 [Xylaria flabelliformis]|nr:hypothetical protein EV127DRAFT_493975 [Xylaria flabelliformis]
MFIDKGIGPNRDGLAVIRSGEHGVLTMSNDSQPEWFPAYYGKGATEVVDATGAGNTFVGAFAVAFQETKDRKEASIRAALAASFALEQFGPLNSWPHSAHQNRATEAERSPTRPEQQLAEDAVFSKPNIEMNKALTSRDPTNNPETSYAQPKDDF